MREGGRREGREKEVKTLSQELERACSTSSFLRIRKGLQTKQMGLNM